MTSEAFTNEEIKLLENVIDRIKNNEYIPEFNDNEQESSIDHIVSSLVKAQLQSIVKRAKQLSIENEELKQINEELKKENQYFKDTIYLMENNNGPLV